MEPEEQFVDLTYFFLDLQSVKMSAARKMRVTPPASD
jgi:hypothetical protein